MMRSAVIICLCVIEVANANSDIVTDLPGLSWKTGFKHYSGYLKATGTKYLHYWFLESANNPEKDPLVLWLNGGPGCSSMDGLLSEHGPFLISDDGLTLKKNSNSWNKVANMLYLEAPAGVGYSYSTDKQYKTNDDQVAQDNHAALRSFLQMYPQFRSNDFYITGESYGGFYVPTLSILVASDDTFRFKGFGVGNGISSMTMNDNSIIYFAYYHGLFGVNLWTSLMKNCCQNSRMDRCDFVHSKDTQCQNDFNEARSIVQQLNIYDLYGECYTTPSHVAANTNVTIIKPLDLWQLANPKKLIKEMTNDPMNFKVVPPCINVTAITTYLNNDRVRQALHIPTDLPAWEICNGVVGSQYKMIYENMTAQYQQLLETDRYRLLVYNGDTDMACNFLSDEWFVDSLNQKLIKPWQQWFYVMEDGSKQIAGFRKQYKNLNFVTVKGAGHMVPQYKPIPALDMFSDFINNRL